MEEKVEKVETEVVEVVFEDETKVEEKKIKRQAIIKKALIAIGGLAVIGGALAVLTKKDDEIEEFSPADLDKHAISSDTHSVSLESVKGDSKNLYRITGVDPLGSETKDDTTASEQNT